MIDNLIIKLNKLGHKVYLLTGSRYQQTSYQKVFERYNFTYDSECIDEIFESTHPDVTIFMGAFDTNFHWEDEEKASVRFSSSLTNILMAFAMAGRGRFIYLSSDEVFGLDYPENIETSEKTSPQNLKGLAFSQGEALCRSYRESRGQDVVVARLDHYYNVPTTRQAVTNLPSKLCLEALEKKTITITAENQFSLLYETDAVEYIYKLMEKSVCQKPLYHITSDNVITERQLAEMVDAAMGKANIIVERPVPGRRCVLSGKETYDELSNLSCCDNKAIVQMIADQMKNNSYVFLTGEKTKPSLYQRLMEKSGWMIKTLVPFAENILGFIVVFILSSLTVNSSYFAKLDLYLLYVLLFAIVYGQQQATFASVLATLGYCINRQYADSGLGFVLDTNTYFWIAQLFILGLTVGYMKDQIMVLKHEGQEERDFLEVQLEDMQDINTSNIRVKDALETQLVNQNDSVGKIYKITSALDYYSPEEVLFYAADVIAQLMGSKDIAVYVVSNDVYARLFSATSKKARSLGNSIRYAEMGEFYESISQHKVYINRQMDEDLPLMANAIFEEDKMQLFVCVWGIPWEHMTLGQANQLTVASALIQDAVLRANRYMAALETQRYIEDSHMLETEAFTTLTRAYFKAQTQELTECTLLHVNTEGQNVDQVGRVLAERMRQTDYVGKLSDNELYALLANTNKADAEVAVARLLEKGYTTEIVEDVIV